MASAESPPPSTLPGLAVVTKLCERFAFASDDVLRVDGALRPAVLGPRESEWANSPADPVAVKAMAVRLYEEAYHRAEGASLPHRRSVVDANELVEQLSAANAGTGSRDHGWRFVEALSDGRVRVRKHGLDLVASAAHVHRIAGSDACVVERGKEARWLFPSYYMAFGNDTPAAGEPESRIYWHASASSAVPLMGAVTLALNRAGLPFRFKVLSSPEGFPRSDAAVAYVPRARFVECIDALRPVHAEVRRALRDATPLFARRVARGLAIADDVSEGRESFGEQRCRLVAEGLWAARAVDSVAERTAAVCRRLEDAGLDLERLHLRSASAPDYPPLVLEGP